MFEVTKLFDQIRSAKYEESIYNNWKVIEKVTVDNRQTNKQRIMFLNKVSYIYKPSGGHTVCKGFQVKGTDQGQDLQISTRTQQRMSYIHVNHSYVTCELLLFICIHIFQIHAAGMDTQTNRWSKN